MSTNIDVTIKNNKNERDGRQINLTSFQYYDIEMLLLLSCNGLFIYILYNLHINQTRKDIAQSTHIKLGEVSFL